MPSAPINHVGKPECDLREVVQNEHRDQHHRQVKVVAPENLVQLNMRWRNAFQIVGGHRHWRRQKRGLQIERDQDAEEERIGAEMGQQRRKIGTNMIMISDHPTASRAGR